MRYERVADARATPSTNLLLAALPPNDRARLDAHLEPFPLPADLVLYEPNAPVRYAYFPTDGVISMVSDMEEGTVEVGTIGREGMAGLPVLLHVPSMPMRVFVQVPGASLRIETARLRDAVRESPALERSLLRSAMAFLDQVAQSTACNRLHTLEERCARWLLMTHDRVLGDELILKQKFLAEMLGVHRPAVTLAAGALQRAGLISYKRGKIQVIDRAGLEHAACECYGRLLHTTEAILRLGAAP